MGTATKVLDVVVTRRARHPRRPMSLAAAAPSALTALGRRRRCRQALAVPSRRGDAPSPPSHGRKLAQILWWNHCQRWVLVPATAKATVEMGATAECRWEAAVADVRGVHDGREEVAVVAANVDAAGRHPGSRAR